MVLFVANTQALTEMGSDGFGVDRSLAHCAKRSRATAASPPANCAVATGCSAGQLREGFCLPDFSTSSDCFGYFVNAILSPSGRDGALLPEFALQSGGALVPVRALTGCWLPLVSTDSLS